VTTRLSKLLSGARVVGAPGCRFDCQNVEADGRAPRKRAEAQVIGRAVGDSAPDRPAELREFAESKRAWRWGYKTAVERLAAALFADEQLVDMATGMSTYVLAYRKAVVLVTDRRVLIAQQKSGGSSGKIIIEEFPLSNISSVESGGGALSARLSIYAPGNKCEVTGMKVDEAQRVAAAVREGMAASSSESASTAPVTSVADELKKLAELRDAGVLTNEEFETQKRRLLE